MPILRDKAWVRLRVDRRGAAATEYIVLLAMLAALALGVVFGLGTDVRDSFSANQSTLSSSIKTASNPVPGGVASTPVEDDPASDPLILRTTVRSGEMVRFLLNDRGAYQVAAKIDWGGPVVSSETNCPVEVVGRTWVECTYAGGGTHRILITGEVPVLSYLARVGNIEAVESWGRVNLRALTAVFDTPANTITFPSSIPSTVEDLMGAFAYWDDRPIPEAASLWNVDQVRVMWYTFAGSNVIPDITGWDTGSVENFGYMFYRSDFNQDIGGWDVGAARDMQGMFREATFFNQDLPDWQVQGVADFSRMFQDAVAFNGEIGTWNTQSAVLMPGMFWNARAFDKPLTNWKTGRVTEFQQMFDGASTFNQPLDHWNVGSGVNFQQIFKDTVRFNQDLNSWDMSKATNVSGMFQNASAFNGLISDWNVGKVDYFGAMFGGAVAFNQDLSRWDVSNANHFPSMFQGARNFQSDLSGWDMSSAIYMSMMFEGASSLSFDISSWRATIQARNRAASFAIGSGIYGDMRCLNVSAVSSMPGNFVASGWQNVPGNYLPLWGQPPPASCTP